MIGSQILITGGIGFLGWELVKTLLEKEDGHIFLLVRSKDTLSASQRVECLLKKDYPCEEEMKEIESRLTVLSGDVSCRKLG